jgi:hypothetical protein
MTTSLFFSLYLSTIVIFTPVNEIWNYNNPRPYPKSIYVFVNWDEGDFKTVNGKLELMKKHMHDNPLKAKARARYWKYHI